MLKDYFESKYKKFYFFLKFAVLNNHKPNGIGLFGEAFVEGREFCQEELNLKFERRY